MIEIDGAYREAGGQILRTATGLAVLTQEPFHIYNIRAGRPEPGLKAQHLTGVKAAAEVCGAKLEGAEPRSTELAFYPGPLKPGEYSFDVGTAGSISLVLQTLTIPAAVGSGPFSFKITGGTDVSWSPSVTYFDRILCYYLEKMGVRISTQVERYGFYRIGGGVVHTTIQPAKALQLLLLRERGELLGLDALSYASEQLRLGRVAERQLEAAEAYLGKFRKKDALYVQSFSPGSSIHLHADYANCRLGAGAIGERGKPAEQVGKEAAELLKKQIESDACVDRWAADQLLPFMAVAAGQGPSEISVAEITNHCRTNIWVIEKFLPVKFEIVEKKGEPGIIRCGKK